MDRITLPNGITIESNTNNTPSPVDISNEALDVLNEYSIESILEAFIACESLYSTEAKEIFDNAKNYQTALKNLRAAGSDKLDAFDKISAKNGEFKLNLAKKYKKNIRVKKYKNEADKLRHETLLKWRATNRPNSSTNFIQYKPSKERYKFELLKRKIIGESKERQKIFDDAKARLDKMSEDINRAKEAGSRASSATANAAKAATGGTTNKAENLANKIKTKSMSKNKKAALIGAGLLATGAAAYGAHKLYKNHKNKQTAAESILAMYE